MRDIPEKISSFYKIFIEPSQEKTVTLGYISKTN